MDIKNEIKDVGEFFKKNTLSIPKYQRGYSWTEENVAELWEDINEKFIEKKEGHFFGSLILAKKNDGDDSLEVVDGQQRLTTFTILFRAMYDMSTYEFFKEQLYEQTISEAPGGYHLTLNESDEKFFLKYIKQKNAERNIRGKSKSEKSIREAYEFFVKSIKIAAEANEVTVDKLVEDLYRNIEKKSQILVITVSNDLDAYTIFESINAKRVDLTPAELLKNYLFSVASRNSASSLGLVEQYWDSVIENLSQYEKQPELTNFIRHHWVSKNKDVREKGLYKEIKSHFKNNYESIEIFMKDLVTESLNYAMIYNPAKTSTENGIKMSVCKDLAALGYQQSYPLVLSLLSNKNLTQDVFDSTITNLTNLFIRRSILTANPNEVEKKIAVAARSLRVNLKNGIKSLNEDIKSLMPKDETIVSAVTTQEISNVRYILNTYELSLSAKGGKTIDSPTIEHIMPQNPQSLEDWRVTEEEHTYWVNNIGNLCLLEKPINSSIRNSSYEIKKAEYQKQRTDMNMVRELLGYKTWDITSIKTRSSKIADFIIKNWPSV